MSLGQFAQRKKWTGGAMTAASVSEDIQNLRLILKNLDEGRNAWGTAIVGNAALATTATSGFLYIPTCAGTPSGTPDTHTGTVPIIYDTTNNKLYIYNGAWKGGTNPGAFT